MCSTASINISDDSFLSDSSLSHVEAVNFDSFHPKQFSTCRSGHLKSLSLDRLCPPNQYQDSIVTKSLLDLTCDGKNLSSQTNQKVSEMVQDSTDFAQLSATILDNTGVFNSFDTTIACDDILVNVDDIEDNDSGVINTPDNLGHHEDIIEVLDTGHSDSLYESLKYQSDLKLCPVLYRSLVTSLNLMTRVPPCDHDHNMCQHCQLYIHNIDTLLETLTNPNKAKKTLTQKEIQKEMIAKARRGENIVVNDKIIACYVCIVIVIILVLIVVIIVLSMFDNQKYRIF